MKYFHRLILFFLWISLFAISNAANAGLSVEEYKEQGRLNLSNKEYRKALENYNQALELDDKDMMLYLGQGNAFKELGELDNALASYSKAIKLQGDGVIWAYNNRGTVYLPWGNIQRLCRISAKPLPLTPMTLPI